MLKEEKANQVNAAKEANKFTRHVPVLSNELLYALNIKRGATVIDATVNGGGHAKMVCNAVGEKGMLIGIDMDAFALGKAKEKLANAGCEIILQEANFRNLDTVLLNLEKGKADAIYFDLGMSSDQLEDSGRGFSFQKDEPLLMTFKSKPGEDDLTARDIVNNWEEENIADIIYGYGEERFAKKIAGAIALSRKEKPIDRTRELVKIIEKAVPRWYRTKKIHFATRTFQALRITVNDEIGALREALRKAFTALKDGGRIAVITFHSIEDRVVKKFFIDLNREGKGASLQKKPIAPGRSEIKRNPRARSAKLRIFQKTPSPAV